MSQTDSNERQFRIDVENLFDYEKRKIKVTHKKKDGSEPWEDVDYPDKGKAKRKRFDLSSREHLEIELLGAEVDDEADFWYIKLPFTADFRFVSERGKEKGIPLIYELARNEGTGGRTIAFVPREIAPTSCKLIISPPGGIKENYKMQNITGRLASDGDEIPDDNVSVGDNGTGSPST
jgi:hypothetical protein